MLVFVLQYIQCPCQKISEVNIYEKLPKNSMLNGKIKTAPQHYRALIIPKRNTLGAIIEYFWILLEILTNYWFELFSLLTKF